MTFPWYNPPMGDNDAQSASESRGGRLNNDFWTGFLRDFPFHLRTPRVAANVDSRIPVAEHDQQEDFEQHFKIPARQPSMKRLRKKVSFPSKGILIVLSASERDPIARECVLFRSSSGHKSSLDESDDILDDVDCEASPHHGVVSNLLGLSRVSHSDRKWGDFESYPFRSSSLSEPEPDLRPRLSRLYSLGGYDADDTRITGETHELLDDLERSVKDQIGLRAMSYKQRRKEAQNIKIRFFVISLLKCQQFIMKLVRALMTFPATSYRIESQLVTGAGVIEVDAEFIHLPNIFLLSFADPETCTSETRFIKCSGRLALGILKTVHEIYRQVVQDEISSKRATDSLDALLNSKPISPVWVRCAITFWVSALICSLAFGWSIVAQGSRLSKWMHLVAGLATMRGIKKGQVLL